MTAPMMYSTTIVCPDERTMRELGRRIQRGLPCVALMTLEGELGAGKSFLARAIIHASGYTGRVKSPTYTLIESYEIEASGGELTRIAHLDLYRLADKEELHYLGFDEVLDSHGLVMIEWPERAGDLLPDADIRILIEYAAGAGRIVRIDSKCALDLPPEHTEYPG